MLATITLTYPRPGTAVLTLVGEFDLAVLAELRAALAATRGCDDVMVHAGGVDFIDCCALRPLLLAARAAARAGGRWRLCEPSPALADLIAWCGLQQHLPVHPAPTPRPHVAGAGQRRELAAGRR